jgi:hypothetical protein
MTPREAAATKLFQFGGAVDVVLGVSMAPKTVRMVLVEGESAGGVTVDEDNFDVAGAAAAGAAADQVIAAILGTRESAAESGHQLQSSGVTWTDPREADALRDALAAHKVENVMLVSAFMAAAALAQAVGNATNCARTALLFVEPTTATLAVVDSSDGSIANVHRQPLPEDRDAVVAELAAMISGAESVKARPDSVFLVGSGVDIPLIKPALEAATSLSVTAAEGLRRPWRAGRRWHRRMRSWEHRKRSRCLTWTWMRPPGQARVSSPTAPLRMTKPASTATSTPIWASSAAASHCWWPSA